MHYQPDSNSCTSYVNNPGCGSHCGSRKWWNCRNWHLLAFGQNDNHPYDYMAEDYNDERARNWRAHYQKFLERLMRTYPDSGG